MNDMMICPNCFTSHSTNVLCPECDYINFKSGLSKSCTPKTQSVEKQNNMDRLYMDIAHRVAQMSHSVRKKVGAVAVKDGNILAFGWNGMPSGFDNCCESGDATNQEVIHAEANLFSKLAKSTGNSGGATLYLTLSPCFECCKLIIQSGIKRVVYSEVYRIAEPIEFLKEAGVEVVYLLD